MPKTPGQLLRSSLKQILVPALQARGFVLTPYLGEDAASRATKIYSPFGKFWRSGSNGDELLIVQIDKYGPPGFGLIFGVVPHDLIIFDATNPGSRSIATSAFWPGWLEVSYSLCSFPFFLRSFRVDWWRGKKHDKVGYDNLVERVVMLLPEVDHALKQDRCGRHISRHDRRPDSKLTPKERLNRRLSHLSGAMVVTVSIAAVLWMLFGFIAGHSFALYLFTFIGVFVAQSLIAIIDAPRGRCVWNEPHDQANTILD